MKILEVVGLTCRVGAVIVLDALSFTLEEGEILALCGSAGAGKTACLRCLGGSLPAESGRLIFDGREVTGLGPRELAQQGLVRASQLPSPPWPLTVADAVALAVRWPRLGRGRPRCWPSGPARGPARARRRCSTASGSPPTRAVAVTACRWPRWDGSRSRRPWPSGPGSCSSMTRSAACRWTTGRRWLA